MVDSPEVPGDPRDVLILSFSDPHDFHAFTSSRAYELLSVVCCLPVAAHYPLKQRFSANLERICPKSVSTIVGGQGLGRVKVNNKKDSLAGLNPCLNYDTLLSGLPDLFGGKVRGIFPRRKAGGVRGIRLFRTMRRGYPGEPAVPGEADGRFGTHLGRNEVQDRGQGEPDILL